MNSDLRIEMRREDHPLTRKDIELLLLEVEGTDKLNLSNQNLSGIDFSNFDLTRANLCEANLRGANMRKANLLWTNLFGANLRGADLRGTNLSRTQLSQANLSEVDLGGTDLSRTYLSGVILREANLSEANLSRTHLSGVNLSGANLNGAVLNGTDLSGADLSKSVLSGADLSGADLTRANLNGAYVKGAYLSKHLKEQLRDRGVIGLDDVEVQAVSNSPTVRVRIIEEPLTVSNVRTIFSFLTDFSVKCWLIAKHRFADLIKYTQTHDERFAEEAQLAITKIVYTPHFTMDWKVDKSTPSVVKALVAAFDGIVQIQKRLEKVDFENQAERQQKDDYSNQIGLLEREKQELEIVSEVVTTLQPAVDQGTRAMLVQMILPNLLQFYKGKGLEVILVESQEHYSSE